MVANQGLKSLNIYDIFANIVPGATFLLGTNFLIDTDRILTELLGNTLEFSLGITVLLVFATVAFVVGQFIQALAARFDGDHGFPAFLEGIRNGNNEELPFELSEFDGIFWELCRRRFLLTENFQSSNRLFKALLAFLEEKERSRALRMQALYLFGRGMFVTFALLTFLYSVGAISSFFTLLSEEHLTYIRSVDVLFVSSLIGCVVTYVFYKEREEFELDWIKYTIIEFYLEMVDMKRYK